MDLISLAGFWRRGREVPQADSEPSPIANLALLASIERAFESNANKTADVVTMSRATWRALLTHEAYHVMLHDEDDEFRLLGLACRIDDRMRTGRFVFHVEPAPPRPPA